MHRASMLLSKSAAQDAVTTTRLIEETSHNGLRRVTETVMNLRWSKMSSTQKQTLVVFAGGAVSYNLFQTYNNGKESLLQFRSGKDRAAFRTEWEAVHSGCRKDSLQIFWRSLMWPVSITSQIVPTAVLWLNKDAKDAKNDADDAKDCTE